MPDGFEHRQEVVFFLLQPFNLNLAIGWGGVSGFLGCGAKHNDAECNRSGRSSADGPSEIPRVLLCFQGEGVASSGYGLSTLAEQLPLPASD